MSRAKSPAHPRLSYAHAHGRGPEPEPDHDAADRARYLDQWLFRHREFGDPDLGDTPVTDRLEHATPWEQRRELACLHKLLDDKFDAPPTYQRQAALVELASVVLLIGEEAAPGGRWCSRGVREHPRIGSRLSGNDLGLK